MKKIIIVCFFLCLCIYAFAQQEHYQISGVVEGKRVFKNVFLFDNSYKIVGKRLIENNRFNFSGNYLLKQPFGEIPFGIILFSDEDSLSNDDAIKPGARFTRHIIMESSIELNYNSDADHFKIKGGILNNVQNKFADNEDLYKKKRDSVYLNIDREEIDESEKKKKKTLIQKELKSKEMKALLNLIRRYPDSPVALFNFMPFTIFPYVPLKESKEVYQSFASELRNSTQGKRFEKMLNEQEEWQKVVIKSALKLGDQMPEFELKDPEGNLVKSKTKFGKYTLIDFWATWCIPCRQEIPEVKKTFLNYNSKGFNVIAISVDNKNDRYKWLDAIEKEGMQQFTNLFNAQGTAGIAQDLLINAIPANYLVDASGKVIAINLRGDGLKNILNKLLR